jgi:trehalose 6-phosphate phosphatase
MTTDDVTSGIDPGTAFVGLDFDGTLAPIVTDPQAARPVEGAVELLTDLARGGTQVAVVSGRDAQTAIRLGELDRIPGVIVSGLHGAQLWRDGRLDSRSEPPGMTEVRLALPSLIGRLEPDARIEDKGLSIVVHTRPARDPAAALDRLAGPVTELAARNGLDVVSGKFVLEIRIPDLSKADALQALLTPHYRAAIYAGDDLGDISAFAQVDRWAAEDAARTGLTIAVGEVAEVRAAARLTLDTPQDLLRVLAGLRRP